MSNQKEMAYRYDLFITPDWRDRFDSLINEHVEIPKEGRVLDVNCGTGAHTLEMAENMRGKGEVIGIDPSPDRIEIARAKAQVKKIEDVTFEQGDPSSLQFESYQFDVVIGDASLMRADAIEDMLAEMVRVAQPGAKVILKMATHGSFDEFFSIYWEALLGAELVEQVWQELEDLIKERATISDAELMARRAGLNRVESFTSKEEFDYETGNDFIESPLIKDIFLDGWLAIVPEPSRADVSARIVSIIDRERYNAPFDVSIKATLIVGSK